MIQFYKEDKLLSLVKKNEKEEFILSLKNWAHLYFKGLFTIITEEKNQQLLIDLWPKISTILTYEGEAVVLKLGGKFLVCQVKEVKFNLLDEIEYLEVYLPDTKKTPKVIDSKKEQYVFFQNNESRIPDLTNVQYLLERLSNIWLSIGYDNEMSKKRILLSSYEKMTPGLENYIKKKWAEGVLFLTTPTESKLPIFNFTPYEVESLQSDLWDDFRKTFNFFRQIVGIRHNYDFKKASMRVSELDFIEAPFLALENEKLLVRRKSINDFERVFGGKYTIIRSVDEDENR